MYKDVYAMYFPCSAKDVYETLYTSLVQPMFEDEEQILRNDLYIISVYYNTCMSDLSVNY